MTPETKSFNGDFLLFRKDGQGMRRPRGREAAHPPRVRHKTMASAETEAGRILQQWPESTIIILQEVGRVKLKPAASDPPSMPMICRRAGCQRQTTHPSGMCEEHRPGFAQATPQVAA